MHNRTLQYIAFEFIHTYVYMSVYEFEAIVIYCDFIAVYLKQEREGFDFKCL